MPIARPPAKSQAHQLGVGFCQATTPSDEKDEVRRTEAAIHPKKNSSQIMTNKMDFQS